MKTSVIVTGASSGIGKGISQTLVGAGYRVLGLARSSDKMAEMAKELGKDSFVPCPVDLADSKSIDNFLAQASDILAGSPLKALINNAGIFEQATFVETSDQVWGKMFQVNLMAPVRLSRGLYPLLKASAPSSVLNISSTLGVRTVAKTSAYSALKAAMNNLSETIALEWATDGIRVNVIAPGLVNTPIHAFHNAPDSAKKAAHEMQPMGRMGLPADIAEAALFLISDKSSWTTGTTMIVDGGVHL